MANYLNEMGRMKCVDERGKSVACPTPKNYGCGAGGCGMGRTMPFSLPVMGTEVGFDLTDGIMGALGGKVLTGIAYPLIYVMGKDKGQTYMDGAKIAMGLATFLGLASERMRENGLFVGFSFSTWPQAAEPLTDWLAKLALRGIQAATGKQILPPAPNGNNATPSNSGTREMGAIPRARRIGASGNTYEVVPNVFRPQQLIEKGSRIGRSPKGMMGKSRFRRPVMTSIA